jgi:hypothetical protein
VGSYLEQGHSDGLAGQPEPETQGLVHDLLEAPAAAPDFLLEPRGDVLLQRECRPHADIMMSQRADVKMSLLLRATTTIGNVSVVKKTNEEAPEIAPRGQGLRPPAND